MKKQQMIDLKLEQLENRVTPTVFTVNALTDTGAGSTTSGDLRYCLTQASLDATGTPEIIEFQKSTFPGTQAAIQLAVQKVGPTTLSINQFFGTPITIDGTITGSANVTIDGSALSSIFQSNANTVTITGITIQDAFGSGIIDNSNSLTIINTTIQNNIDPSGNGAGILENSGTLVLDGVTMTNNTAKEGDGGGVYVSKGTTLNMDDGTLIQNNQAGGVNAGDGYGGGIYSLGTMNFTLGPLLLQGQIIFNTAQSGQGGGVYNDGTASFDNILFTGNLSQTEGGAIFNGQGGNFTLTNSNVQSNTSNTQGGGIYSLGGLTATNISLIGNSAETAGGGLAAAGGTVSITNSTINTSVLKGANADGGGVYLSNAQATFIKTTISQNNINNSGNGAGIYLAANSSSTFNFSIGSIDHNSLLSGGLGGGIYLGQGDTVILSADLVSSNTAGNTGTGGGIYGDLKSTVQINTTNITQNTAGVAGAIYDNSILNITNSNITFNTSTTGLGGALFDDVNSKTNLNTVSLLSNTSKTSGGAIYNNGNLIMTVMQINNNTAQGLGVGGAIDNDSNGIITVTNATISGNSAAQSGAIDNTGQLTGQQIAIFNNNAKAGSGGAVTNQVKAQFTLTDATIANNNATAKGGGFSNSGSLTLIDSTVAFNNSGSAFFGGGIYDAAESVTLYNTIVADNHETTTHTIDDIDAAPSISLTGSYNLIGVDNSLSFQNGSNNNIVININDPGLEVLGDYGGTTETVATLVSSQAIGAGSNSINGVPLPTTDQRGFALPTSTNRDIGAFQNTPLTVNTLGDNLNTGSGLGLLSLRQAVNIANGDYTTLTDTITFNPTVYNGNQNALLTAGNLISISRTSGQVVIDGGANGAANVVLIRIASSPIFQIGAGTNVTLRGLVLKNGSSSTNGGAIINQGTLTIQNSTLAGNVAVANGGAIYNTQSLNLLNDSISGNTAGAGGAIYSTGTFTINNSSITGNTVQSGLTPYGGGIYNTGTGTMSNTTLSNNQGQNGGAIYNSGTITIADSTLNANSATGTSNTTGFGGGLEIDLHGQATIIDTTFYGNIATTGGGIYNGGTFSGYDNTITANQSGAAAHGGGIYGTATALTTINNTIVAGNFISLGSTPDDIFTGSAPVTGNNNLIGTGGSGGLSNGVNGNITNVANPGLGTLANNGGVTQTVAIALNSPAVNAGNNAIIPTGFTTDQRGSGFNRIVNGTVDIGAFENQYTPPPPPPPPSSGGSSGSGSGSTSSTATYYAVAASFGSPRVNVYNSSNQLIASFYAFNPIFHVGVTVAVGDINGDGTPDIIVGAGPGGGPAVEVIDGTKLNQVMSNGQISPTALIASFYAFESSFTGGVNVAVGHFEAGVNRDQVVVGAGPGGGPRIVVIDPMSGAMLKSFYAFEPTFTGGVNVAAADLNGDGISEIVVGAESHGGPHVNVFDGVSGNLLWSYFAYSPTFTGGVYVAAGNGEIITGTGPGTVSQVNVYQFSNQSLVGQFYAYGPAFSGGVRVAVSGNSILTGPGYGGGPQLETFNQSTLGLVDSQFAFESNFTGGIYVG